MVSEATRTHEKDKLKELSPEDLKAICAALVALAENDDISRQALDEENAVRLFIKEWLQGRNPSSRLEGVTFLQVPSFYLNTEQIERIAQLEDVDDFPVLEPDDLTYIDDNTGVEMRRGKWQTSLFAMSMRVMGIEHTASVSIQPARSKWAYTSGEKIAIHTDAWDSNGRFSPPMGEEVADFLDILIKYGEELNEDSSTT